MPKATSRRSFDIYQVLVSIWQSVLRPLTKRLSIRVTRRGLYWISAWAVWVIVISFINLLVSMPSVREQLGIAILSQWLILLQWLTYAISLALFVGLLVDYLRLMMATRKTASGLESSLAIQRKLHSNLSAQAWTEVKLILSHPTPPSLFITLTDNYPNLASTEQLPIEFHSKQLAQSSTRSLSAVETQNSTIHQLAVSYQMYTHERGDAIFDGVDMLVKTRIGWLQKFIHIPETHIQGTHHARVLANFADIAQGQLAGVSRQAAVSGILKQRRKGQGQDFHQIRNYTQGDSIRHLDWKATARYQKLMTREFQDERDQQILFLLDCGQHMRHIRFFDPQTQLSDVSPAQPSQNNAESPLDNPKHLQGSHLDQALNAMLLLADIANQQGDATGFISFAGENNKVIAPKKGAQVISYLLNQSFDLQPSSLIPDYIAVARQVRQVQKKRALIILITNTRQEEHSELTEAIQLMGAKHVVILANLYEQDLKEQLATPPTNLAQALTYHSIQEYMNTRERLHAELNQKTNVYTINTTPKQLPQQLIHQYFLIKQRHRL